MQLECARKNARAIRFVVGWVALVVLALMRPASAAGRQAFENFVRRDGDVLKDGNHEFRFLSFNIPNLHYVEDDMRFGQSMPFRLPDMFEIDDALGAIEQIGGRVVRTYTLSVKKADDPADLPRYILGPGQFNEEAFRTLDQVLAAAHRHRVRLIIPFVDMWSWWGGVTELAAFRGKKVDEVWTDPQLVQDYKDIITFVLNRTNTVTGVRYRDDKAILAWETGNELQCPYEWTKQIVAHIKSQDARHLVVDGTHRQVLLPSSLDDANIDFVSTHHYEKDPRDMIAHIVESAKMARGKKPYHLGEFGFLGTDALCAVMDTVRDEKLTGALLWSLRYRSRDGGFYWHHEPAGGDFFKAYHWPGFAAGEKYDERRLMQCVRERAFALRGLTAPPLPKPQACHLLSVTEGGRMTWQGAVGAASYDVERAEKAGGPWTIVGADVSDAQVQYRPLFVDESVQPGKSYYYRVVARNISGSAKPSNVVGPTRMTHRTLVDELWNDSRIFAKEGTLQFAEKEARKFKEDCHRLAGSGKSAIIYRAPGGIQAARVFLFSQPDQPAVSILFAKDGRTFAATEPQVARTITNGEQAYGFWKALLYTATSAEPGCDYVRIEFPADVQLSRVEIDYGGAQ